MSKKGLPYFKLYALNFLTDINYLKLNHEAKGKLFDLMMLLWNNGLKLPLEDVKTLMGNDFDYEIFGGLIFCKDGNIGCDYLNEQFKSLSKESQSRSLGAKKTNEIRNKSIQDSERSANAQRTLSERKKVEDSERSAVGKKKKILEEELEEKEDKDLKPLSQPAVAVGDERKERFWFNPKTEYHVGKQMIFYYELAFLKTNNAFPILGTSERTAFFKLLHSTMKADPTKTVGFFQELIFWCLTREQPPSKPAAIFTAHYMNEFIRLNPKLNPEPVDVIAYLTELSHSEPLLRSSVNRQSLNDINIPLRPRAAKTTPVSIVSVVDGVVKKNGLVVDVEESEQDKAQIIEMQKRLGVYNHG